MMFSNVQIEARRAVAPSLSNAGLGGTLLRRNEMKKHNEISDYENDNLIGGRIVIAVVFILLIAAMGMSLAEFLYV